MIDDIPILVKDGSHLDRLLKEMMSCRQRMEFRNNHANRRAYNQAKDRADRCLRKHRDKQLIRQKSIPFKLPDEMFVPANTQEPLS